MTLTAKPMCGVDEEMDGPDQRLIVNVAVVMIGAVIAPALRAASRISSLAGMVARH